MCRFEVEDVDDELPGNVAAGDSANTSATQNTITSLAYNTSEAVPNTLYYRDDAVGDGKHRPSLEALQLGKPLRINEVSVYLMYTNMTFHCHVVTKIICTPMHTCICTCMYMYEYECVHTCLCACTYYIYAHVCMHVCMCMFMYVCVCVCLCMCVCVCV